jgi:predicted dehydrogenase
MTDFSSINRRQFIHRIGAIAGIAAAPALIPSRTFANFRQQSPNDRINAAAIGVGKQGSGLLHGFLRTPGVQVVAVCDVDRDKLERARQWVDSYYTERTGSTYSGCQATVDFREIIGSKDIDIVVIATPDHWHTLPSILSVRAGKDVYCEKPLTLTLDEGRVLTSEVRRTGRVLQTGSMQRSSDQFRFACELVRNGYIGDVRHVRISISTGFIPHPIDCDLPAEATPAVLEWDIWQGQAPVRPYNAIIAPPISFDGYPAWRNYRAYSGGGMTDWGAHHFDIAQWGLGMDESGPVQITPAALSDYKLLTYRYQNGIEMTTDFDDNFIRFEGSDGIIRVNRSYLITEPQTLLSVQIKPDEIHLNESKNHIADFISAVRDRRRPIADVAIGARSVAVCHLGNLAQQLGRTLHWNPEKEEFICDDEANRLRGRAQRSPWEI